MKHRDEALKKIPPNVDKLIKDLNHQMGDNMERMERANEQFTTKVNITDFELQVKRKLDCDVFFRVFPEDISPSETLRNMMKVQSEMLSKRVIEMVKLWDQKICNLRNELNIQGLKARLNKMAIKEEIDY